MMNGRGKSDRLRSTGEAAEQSRGTGRGGGGGKGAGQGELARAQRAPDAEPGRCAQRARAGTSGSATKDRKQRFTALLHHVYDVERLRAAYFALKRDAAAGVDGETWRHYGEKLEANLQDLSDG